MKITGNCAFCLVLSVVCVCLLACGDLVAADWPLYRCDAQRSGYTSQALPRGLSLSWVYRSTHLPQPAWIGPDTRMPFDQVFQPIVAKGMLFFASSVDCKVYALDAASGMRRWVFFTDAPVRFAPAFWQDRLFVVGDDGFLYCLKAEDGRLLWKFRGGPSASMVLGNDRVISRWPARGGPVVSGTTVYFAAGIWPSEGVYLYALDAASGEVLWCNDEAGFMYMPQPHRGAEARSGISAQGYLVVSGDILLVPTGRAVPAAFARSDGRFRYFHLQEYGKNKGGGSAIVAGHSYFMNGGFVFDLPTGSVLAQIGVDALAVSVTPECVIYVAADQLVALSCKQLFKQATAVNYKGNGVQEVVLNDPLWRVPLPHEVCSLIVAGDAVIVGGKGRVSIMDIETKRALFCADVDGVAYGLAVAGDVLYVSTDKGVIYCFGTAGSRDSDAVDTGKTGWVNTGVATAADEIVKMAGCAQGYCLDMGCEDGRLIYELATRSSFYFVGVESDFEKVSIAREHLDRAGLYGVRAVVLERDMGNTGLPDYFANLAVSCRSVMGNCNGVDSNEIDRLLRPFGGVVCSGGVSSMKRIVRGPLQGSGCWTHQYCDPANTVCSSDALLARPLQVLWFKDFGFQMPSRHGRGYAPLFFDGRLFVEGLDGVLCIDAYNGCILWRYPLLGVQKAYDQEHRVGTSGTGSNLCVTGKGLYLRIGAKCLEIDPAVGRIICEFDAPKYSDGTSGTWGYLACVEDTLFGTLADTSHIVKWCAGVSDMQEQFTQSRLFFAISSQTGGLKWQYQPKHSIRHNAIAIGSGAVYLIDGPLALSDRLDYEAPGSIGVGSDQRGGFLIALSAADGKVLWRSDDDIYGTMLALSTAHSILLMAYQDTRYKLPSEGGGRMAAFDSKTGVRIWDIAARYDSRPIVNGRTIYAQPGAWDLLTGERRDFNFSRSHGCGIIASSCRLMVFRSATLGYVDLLDYKGTENYGGIRPGCWINALPAGGLVLMPDATDGCTCGYLIKASIALQPRRGGGS